MRSNPRLSPAGRTGFFAVFVAAIVGVLIAVLPNAASAAGTVTPASRDLTEADGRWKLAMTIDFGSVPQVPHIPMIFSFTPVVLYERALTDKSPDKPMLNKIPLQNQQSINEGMDVGFSNAAGKTFKVTKFDFVIRRDHGFEAGEYDLKIKREDDGVQMGQTIHLVLKGDNEVVDRRAMVFSGEKKSKKKDEKKDDEKKDDEKKEEPAAAEGQKSEEGADPNAGGAPPPVPPKQGGCGCRFVGDGAPSSGAALVALAAAAAIVTRRRARR